MRLVTNTCYLEKHLGWTGIGIDALAEYAMSRVLARPGETPTIALNHLLTRESVNKIELSSPDIEGFEMPALRGFDIERFAPELMVVQGHIEEVAAYFAEHGDEGIERYRAFDRINHYFRSIGETAVAP